MSLNLGIRLALEAEGFDQGEITQIEAVIPRVLKLLAAYKLADPDIAAVIPVAEMVINKLKGETK